MTRFNRTGGWVAALLVLAGAGLGFESTGCTRIGANATVNVMEQASPAIQSVADPGIAEGALPYSIAQMEGLLLVVPDNARLRISAMRAHGSYGYAFLEDRMEQAEVGGDEQAVEHYRARASAAYLRGKELGFDQLNREEDGDGGPTAAFRRGIDGWNAYLRRFDDADAVPLLFWTGYNWARYINLHKDDVDAVADLPFAIAMFERCVALDPTFNLYGPHAAMASYHAGRPPALGGQPQEALRHFEAAINGTHRHFLTYQVMMARTYAVQVQDRALYRRLLHEVICAGDVMPAQRLANQLAKRRALRYAAQLNDLFEAPENGAQEGDLTQCDESSPAEAPEAESTGETSPGAEGTTEAPSGEGTSGEAPSGGTGTAQPDAQ